MRGSRDGQDSRVEAYRLLIADVYELAGLSRTTSEAIARDVGGGQTVARWHVMSVVSESPLTVPQIARRLGLARQSVQRVVDDLVATGHLEQRLNPAHRRSVLVQLTGHGRTALRDVNAASHVKRAEELSRADLSATQLEDARATIRTLIAALSGQADEH